MKKTLKTAFVSTIPVLTGYLVLGFGFGIIMNSGGFGMLPALAMSLFIYAGSMQYVAIGLLTGGRKTPALIEKLGKMLPYAIMGMLVVYCLKDVHFASVGAYLPQLIACSIVGVLYVWRRNTLLSILAGTVSYMVLIQLVF